MSTGIVLRDEAGLFLPGGATPNTEGLNQYTRGSDAAVLRRLKTRTLDKLSHEPEVEALSENWAAALTAPDLAPHTARIAAERIWPAKHADAGDDGSGGETQSPSEGERLQLAEVFGEAFPEGEELVLEPDVAAVAQGAD